MKAHELRLILHGVAAALTKQAQDEHMAGRKHDVLVLNNRASRLDLVARSEDVNTIAALITQHFEAAK